MKVEISKCKRCIKNHYATITIFDCKKKHQLRNKKSRNKKMSFEIISFKYQEAIWGIIFFGETKFVFALVKLKLFWPITTRY